MAIRRVVVALASHCLAMVPSFLGCSYQQPRRAIAPGSWIRSVVSQFGAPPIIYRRRNWIYRWVLWFRCHHQHHFAGLLLLALYLSWSSL